MQPLETEPAILPERVTTIFEPSGRGLEPHVSTTVARAMSSPACVHSFSSPRTSRTYLVLLPHSLGAPIKARQQTAQVVQRLQVVRGKKIVAVRQRSGHAAGEWFVSLRPE